MFFYKGNYYGNLINCFIPAAEKIQMMESRGNAHKESSYERGDPLVNVNGVMEIKKDSIRNRKDQS